MKTIALCANTEKPRSRAALRLIVSAARRAGLTVTADPATAALAGGRVRSLPFARLFKAVDAVVSLGGDGTLLTVVSRMHGADAPVLGINVGGLGFLTSVSAEEIERACRCLERDEFTLQSNPMLEATVCAGNHRLAAYHAVNEIAVARGATPRLVHLDVRVDGHLVTTYSCDGILVATPVGSTGYSLSAGGPILPPGTPAWVISVICPHSLGSRPIVVPDDSVITIDPHSATEDLALAADGRSGRRLAPGNTVRIRRSPRAVRLLHLPGHDYYDVLRRKLNWRGSNVR
jgi:NAD+ kinase